MLGKCILYLFMHKLLLRDTKDYHNLALLFNRVIPQKGEHENTKFQQVIIQGICLVLQVNQYARHAELA